MGQGAIVYDKYSATNVVKCRIRGEMHHGGVRVKPTNIVETT